MPTRMKLPTTRGSSSSEPPCDPPCNPGKRPITQSPSWHQSKKPMASYSPGRDAMSLKRYNHIFFRCFIITKSTVTAETLHIAFFMERLEGIRWMPFISVSDPMQEEVVRVFYANMFEINMEDLFFWTMVCNTPVQVSLAILSDLFGVPHPPAPIVYPVHRLTMEQKGGMVQNLCGKFMDWPDQLPHKQCKAVVQVLHRIFTYNILLTTNLSVLTDDTAYLIGEFMNNAQINLPTILYHTIIRAHDATHSTSSLPYPTIITWLLQAAKVPFKVDLRDKRASKPWSKAPYRRWVYSIGPWDS